MEKIFYLSSEKMNSVWATQELSKINALMNKKHALSLNDECFSIQAECNEAQIQLCVSLNKDDKSTIYPIECVFMKEEGEKVVDAEITVLMLDYLDVYWTEYFSSDRNVFCTLDWSAHLCEEHRFYVRGFVRHKALEDEANALLEEMGHGQYHIEPISIET